MDILKAWNAGFVKRWHTNPVMVDTDDRNNAHQHRCTVLLLLFFPDSPRGAIIDCLIHDQGEIDSGDLSYMVKQQFPEMGSQLQKIEDTSIYDQGFIGYQISESDLRHRKWVDRLDSYLWMLRNKPHLRLSFEWEQQQKALTNEATELNVEKKYFRLMQDAMEFYIPR